MYLLLQCPIQSFSFSSRGAPHETEFLRLLPELLQVPVQAPDFASHPAAHMDGVHLSGRPALKERETRLTREKWSQDNVLIKVPMFNGKCTYKGRRLGPFPPIHPWSLEPGAGDDVQDRAWSPE